MKIDDIVKTKFASPQMKALINVRITSNYISLQQNNFMREFDLSMAQFNILRILRGAGEPLTINTIKNRMIEKSPNTTRLMDKLADKTFIEKFTCSEDRRQSYVKITEEGLAILSLIDESDFAKGTRLLGLSDLEAETLSDLLDKLRAVY